MSTYAHNINLVGVDVDGDLSDGLGSIGVEEDLLGSTQSANLSNGLDHTNLVVDGHDGHQSSVGSNGGLQLLHVNETGGQNGQVSDLEALILQVSARVQNALVLGLGGDDVSLSALVEPGNTLDDHVVGLGGAGGEDDLLGVGSD